jgi:hypothetical protein
MLTVQEKQFVPVGLDRLPKTIVDIYEEGIMHGHKRGDE